MRIGCFFELCFALYELGEEHGNRVISIQRCEINHQPMLVNSDWSERKCSRFRTRFQVEHQARRVRPILPNARLREHAGVVFQCFERLVERGVGLHVADIHNRSVRVGQRRNEKAKFAVGFDRDACGGLAWPSTHGEHPRACEREGSSPRADKRSQHAKRVATVHAANPLLTVTRRPSPSKSN